MNLLRYPVEILYNIGEYLDLFDILRLKSVNRYCYNVYKCKIDEKINEYFVNLEINNIDDIDDVNKLFYIHVIFYIKRCIANGDSGILNITFMKIYNNNTKFNYKLFANVNNKCVYFLKNLYNFGNNIDGLERFLLSSKINNRKIVKTDNVSNVSDIISLYRINYNEIIERTELDRNEIIERTELDRKEIIDFNEDLIMVTFYFFL